MNLETMRNAEKADVIDDLSGKYRLGELLDFLAMAKSSYFHQKNAALKPDKYADLKADGRSCKKAEIQFV